MKKNKKQKKAAKKSGGKNDIILEIGTEEIPADYLAPASSQLAEETAKRLEEQRITIKKISSFYTVRRIIVYIESADAAQKDLAYEKKGPRYDVAYKDGVITDIGKKFLEKCGIKEKELKIKEEKNNKFLFAHIFEKEKKTSEVLAEIFPAVISKLRFPKSMVWDNSGISFARPVRRIMCLMNGRIIPFKLGKVKSSDVTYGHKYLYGEKPVRIKTAAGYFKAMKKHSVIISQEERKKEIMKKISGLLSKRGLSVIRDDELLEKVAGSVEAVSVMAGKFDERYLFLPEQVIITAMREHQRYFAVKKGNRFTNLFINVRDGGEKNNPFIAKQHAKVLYARLNDAEFFYNEDLKKPLENNNDKLKNSIFIAGLGSMKEKTERLESVASKAGEIFGYPDPGFLEKAARFLKADLETNMVGEKEFNSLRGFMGGAYLSKQGKDEKTCAAVRDHYLPGFTGDRLPETEEGALLSLTDKMDNLYGFFLAGYRPTGSKDPYAVRRLALNIIYMIIEKKIRFDLKKLIKVISEAYKNQFGKEYDAAGIADFFIQRQANYFKEKKIDYDIINAVSGSPGAGLDILAAYEKALVLMKERKSSGFNSVVFAVSRINNILPENFVGGDVFKGVFDTPQEGVLYEKFLDNREKMIEKLSSGDYSGCYEVIVSIKPEIDAYFDKVLVNTDDPEKKKNRLNMLSEMRDTIFKLADFSKLVIDRK